MAKNRKGNNDNDKIGKLIISINELVKEIKKSNGSSASNESLSNVSASINDSINRLNSAVNSISTNLSSVNVNNLIANGVNNIMDAIVQKIQGTNIEVSGSASSGSQQQQPTGTDGGNGGDGGNSGSQQQGGDSDKDKLNEKAVKKMLDFMQQRDNMGSYDFASVDYHMKEIAALEYKVQTVQDALTGGVDFIFQSWLDSFYDMKDEIQYRREMLRLKDVDKERKDFYDGTVEKEGKVVSNDILTRFNENENIKKISEIANGSNDEILEKLFAEYKNEIDTKDVDIDGNPLYTLLNNNELTYNSLDAFKDFLDRADGNISYGGDLQTLIGKMKNLDYEDPVFKNLNEYIKAISEKEAYDNQILRINNRIAINKRKIEDKDFDYGEDEESLKSQIRNLESLKRIYEEKNENIGDTTFSKNNPFDLENLQEDQIKEKIREYNEKGANNLSDVEKEDYEILNKAMELKQNGDERSFTDIIKELREIKKIEAEINARAEYEYQKGVNRYANKFDISNKVHEKGTQIEQAIGGFGKMAEKAGKGSGWIAKLAGKVGWEKDEKTGKRVRVRKGLAGAASKINHGLTKITNKANPYLMIADMLFSAVKMGLGTYLAWQKTTTENYFRALNAITTKDINMMKVALDAWSDSLNGAYSALQMLNETNLTLIKAANENRMAMTKMRHGEVMKYIGSIPLVADGVKMWYEYSEQQLELMQKRQEIEIENANKRISQASEYAKKSDEYLKKQDQAIHQYQTVNGLTKEQTKIFGDRMMAIGPKFAEMFNKTIEDAIKIENSFVEQSGRAVTYSDKDYERTFGVGRFVGDENVTQFQAMMHIFNSSVANSADIMYDLYNYANKTGLSQKKLVKEVLGNLKLANKYNFKEGTKGFIELAKWAENARISLSSIGSAIEKVQSGGLEGVIQQAANLQVLGGNIAMYSDPLAMMYESLNDPKMYAQRIQGMLRGFGVFNKSTGETTFNDTEMLIMRNLSQQLGISHEELNNMARGARQKQYVMRQMRGTTLNRDEQDVIANKAQFNKETGRWYVNTIGGKTLDVSQVTSADMPKILSDNKEERAEQYAKETLSSVEQIEATTKFIGAILGGETYKDYLETVSKTNDVTKSHYVDNKDGITEIIELMHDKSIASLVKALDDMVTSTSQVEEAFKKLDEAAEAAAKSEKELENLTYDEIKKTMTTPKLRDYLQEKYRNGTATRHMIRDMQKNPVLLKGLTNDEKYDVLSKDTLRSLWQRTFRFHYDTRYNTEQKLANSTRLEEYDENKSDDYYELDLNDGLLSSNNTPMLTQASSITPINDGSVKLAKSDPKDTALFAKTGGPFDTLFNGILAKINQVHEFISAKAMPYLMPSETSYYRHFSEANRSNQKPESIKMEPVNINLSGSLNLVGSGGQSFNIIEELKKSPMLLQQLANMLTIEFGRAIAGRSTSSNDVRRMLNVMR